MVVAKYPIKQSETCETMRILWRNCKNNIGPMSELKSRYTEAYCDERIAEIDAADALPDEAARAEVHEMLRKNLVTLGGGCTGFWKRLKSYINDIFKGEEERRIQYNAAGWGNYEAAAAHTWQAVHDLMQSGSNYIAANDTILKGENNDNMPAGFPQQFNAAWAAFKVKRKNFEDAENNDKEGAAAKVTAINNCYDLTTDMDADGQTVFAKDDVKKKLFSFEAQSKLVAESSPASFEVLVLVNGVPKPGVEISIENTDKELVTGSDGKALFTQMHKGPLTTLVECDGFVSKQVAETLEAGVRKRITVTLEPLFDGALKVGPETVENTVTTPEVPINETVNGSMQ